MNSCPHKHRRLLAQRIRGELLHLLGAHVQKEDVVDGSLLVAHEGRAVVHEQVLIRAPRVPVLIEAIRSELLLGGGPAKELLELIQGLGLTEMKVAMP